MYADQKFRHCFSSPNMIMQFLVVQRIQSYKIPNFWLFSVYKVTNYRLFGYVHNHLGSYHIVICHDGVAVPPSLHLQDVVYGVAKEKC